MDQPGSKPLNEARAAQTSALTAMPEFYMRNMQRTSAKMLRAQERMMQGLTEAAQLQMKFTQEFWSKRGTLAREHTGAEAAHATTHEGESMMGVMREISETMQRSFTEAMQVMMENAQQMAEDARETQKNATESLQQAGRSGMRAAQDVTESSMDRAQDNIGKVQDSMKQGMDRLKAADEPFRAGGVTKPTTVSGSSL
jgi:uncharacterized phage infection (PIP) family protein YhgE